MKSSTSVGVPARLAFNCEWKIVPIANNRNVAARPITNGDKQFTQCKDCQRDSQFIIVELSRFTPAGRRSDHDLVWGWCGVCDIGRQHEQ